ncbi:hypothetical protein WN944_011135 [Citrus x changshan-huyou]|uniref:Uncharacterized protein n=1 Tax=Citrus x changshan-huyou TaxID=2935761 RepID=A0AAP0MV06_9ROSI
MYVADLLPPFILVIVVAPLPSRQASAQPAVVALPPLYQSVLQIELITKALLFF